MTNTPSSRVERALRGEPVFPVPFTVYQSKLPRCRVERDLRNAGLCPVHRMNVLRTRLPDVKVTETTYAEEGKRLSRTQYDTPEGSVWTISEPAGFTSWRHKPLFSGPEDYAALRFLIDNEHYEPDYAAYARAVEVSAGDGFYKSNFGLEPFQRLISGGIMGTTNFAMEWMERRDEVLKLYEACVRAARRRYELTVESPCDTFNYGGNVTVEVIGRQVFEEYYLPHYEEAAEAAHKRGKRVGCHLDANNGLIKDLVASSPLDYIEAFTPAPDTDMTLAGAFAAWPGKTVWINFPSSVHLASQDRIAEVTRDLLETARDRPGFLVGITEDVPEDRWQENFKTIMRIIREFG